MTQLPDVSAEAYWRALFSDRVPATVFPLDSIRSQAALSRRASLKQRVLPELAAEIEAYNGQQMARFSMLLAAFKLLAFRYSGQEQVQVGSLIATACAETDGHRLVTIPLRTHLTGTLTVEEAISRVQATVEHAAQAKQKLPSTLESPGNSQQEPLVRLLFILEGEQSPLLDASLRDWGALSDQINSCDLILVVQKCGQDTALFCDYSADLFQPAFIAALLEHYQIVLRSLFRQPTERIDKLPLLAEAERQRILVEWNRTERSFPPLCFPQLFELQVLQTPEVIAAAFGDQTITYRELNRRANQLAHYLREQGVGPEILVGICIERSLEMLIGLLAILKAGAAYVPLDARYPSKRIAYMLEDAQVMLLVTQASLLEQLPGFEGQVICLDRDWGKIAAWTDENIESGLEPANLAYVIYTSGSTGRPKGVVIVHSALSNFLNSMRRQPGLKESDRLLAVTTLSFDIAALELFLPLTVGARVEIASHSVCVDGTQLLALLERSGSTVMQATPATWRLLLDAGWQRTAGLKVLCGGEQLPQSLVLELLVRAEQVWNMYGPTETTIWSAIWRVEPGVQRVLIGRPIDNTQIYVLDEHLQPLPPGVLGQIFIGGTGLAGGYHRQPELTAERFVPNPFNNQQSTINHQLSAIYHETRLYQTGDLGRFLPDGSIECLGRIDQQVKLRGFRIELGEIETLLASHPLVQQAVVHVREDNASNPYLAAYLVADPTAGIELADWQVHTLPNRQPIVPINKNETDHLYELIFEDQIYACHSLAYPDGACIFDVGANIGLFAIYAHQVCRNPTIYAFEPLPPIFDVLHTNDRFYGFNMHLCPYGLSDAPRQIGFTYYPKWTALSGAYADSDAESRITRTFLSNQDALLAQYSDELIGDRFQCQSFVCHLRPLSDVIRELGVERIDVLKINVEKGELDVLRGIREEDWPKISQLVIEVHDLEGRLSQLVDLLEQHSYRVSIAQNPRLRNTELYIVYAIHAGFAEAAPKQERCAPQALEPVRQPLPIAELQALLRQHLPAYMLPSAYVVMPSLPLTANGKIDRKALPAPRLEERLRRFDQPILPPQSTLEETIAQVWRAALGVPAVGVNQNFFDLGGNSLLATRVHSQLRERLGLTLLMTQMFQYPTIHALAQYLERQTDAEIALAPVRERATVRRQTARVQRMQRLQTRTKPEEN